MHARDCLLLVLLQLRFHRLTVTDSSERAYGQPNTSRWAELIEVETFPQGLPANVDIIGCTHPFDVADNAHDGSRKSGNFYGCPAGVGNKLWGNPDVWPPIAYVPQWEHPDTEGMCTSVNVCARTHEGRACVRASLT